MGQGFIHNDYDPTNGNSYWVHANCITWDQGIFLVEDSDDLVFDKATDSYSVMLHDMFRGIVLNLKIQIVDRGTDDGTGHIDSYFRVYLKNNNDDILMEYDTSNPYSGALLDAPSSLQPLKYIAITDKKIIGMFEHSITAYSKPEILISSNPNQYEEHDYSYYTKKIL